MTRSRLCIALLAILAFVLTACGGGGSSPSGPTEIAVWHGYQDTEGDVFKGLIDQYNKDHPDVKVSELYSSNDGWRSNAIEVLGRLDKAQGN